MADGSHGHGRVAVIQIKRWIFSREEGKGPNEKEKRSVTSLVTEPLDIKVVRLIGFYIVYVIFV